MNQNPKHIEQLISDAAEFAELCTPDELDEVERELDRERRGNVLPDQKGG